MDEAPDLETATVKEINVYLDLFKSLDLPADKQWASELTLKALKDKGKLLPDMSWTTLLDGTGVITKPTCDFSQADASKELHKRDAKRKSMS